MVWRALEVGDPVWKALLVVLECKVLRKESGPTPYFPRRLRGHTDPGNDLCVCVCVCVCVSPSVVSNSLGPQ